MKRTHTKKETNTKTDVLNVVMKFKRLKWFGGTEEMEVTLLLKRTELNKKFIILIQKWIAKTDEKKNQTFKQTKNIMNFNSNLNLKSRRKESDNYFNLCYWSQKLIGNWHLKHRMKLFQYVNFCKAPKIFNWSGVLFSTSCFSYKFFNNYYLQCLLILRTTNKETIRQHC